MRLLHARDLHFEEFFEDDKPEYVILSHQWEHVKEEVKYKDLLRGMKRHTKGYDKIMATCGMALRHGYTWVWVDTCCIDSTSSAELSEAINSMFRWYQNAAECCVYLNDVTWLEKYDGSPSTNSSINISPQPSEGRRLVGSPASRTQFRSSRWHTRSWTLQELLAPSKLVFYDKDWHFIGRKENLCADIAAATGIDIKYLIGTDFHEANAATKMNWAAHRKCVRIEDLSYSLLGIFNVNMPIIYGEGGHAFGRLQEEIWRSTNDKSLFAWMAPDEQTGKRTRAVPPPPGASWREITAAFAPSPRAFMYYQEQIKADEDKDDIVSRLSMDGMDSTATGSSATLIGEALVAAEEFVDILRKDEQLDAIFSAAMKHVTLEELRSKIREILKIYSIDLQQEASNSLEKDAVQLVRRRRAFIALRICQPYDTSTGMRESQFAQITQQDPDKRALLEEYARTRSGANVESEPVRERESGDEDEPRGSPPSSAGEPDKLEPTDLDRVKAFMVQSAAYERLKQNLRDFILSYGESGQTIGKIPVPRGILSTDLWHRLQMKGLEVIQSVKMLCRPVVPTGYDRMTWICGCGEQRYADVRQYAPQGAARLQAALRNSATTVAKGAAGDDQSGNPTRPAQAHLSSGLSTESSFQIMSQFIYARSTDPNSTGRVSLNSVYTSMPDPEDEADHVFLLLCITVNGVSTLEQLSVGGIENDRYLFDKIREAYRQLHIESAWHQKVALTRRIVAGSGRLAWLFQAIDLTIPHSISFVRFHLAPVRMVIRPWNFESPELPPEIEVRDKKTYHYTPCPAGVNLNDLNRELIHSLLKPDQQHYDHFWLDLFPKKLKQELLYKSGSSEMCTGWGIHIVEGINGFSVILLMLALVSISGILGVVYSVLTHDVGGGFGMATFVGMLPALGLAALQLMPAS